MTARAGGPVAVAERERKKNLKFQAKNSLEREREREGPVNSITLRYVESVPTSSGFEGEGRRRGR